MLMLYFTQKMRGRDPEIKWNINKESHHFYQVINYILLLDFKRIK